MGTAVASRGIQRKGLVLALLLLPVPMVVLSWILLREDLPETLATHWSGSSLPDGFSSTQATLMTCLGISVAGAVLGLVAFGLRKPGWQAGLLFTGGLAAWCAASSWLVSASTTATAGDPQQAVLGGWLAILILGSLLGIAPAWLSGSSRELNRTMDYQRKLRIAQAQGRPLPEPLPAPEAVFRQAVNAPAWLWLMAVGILLLMLVLFWISLPDMAEEGIVALLIGPLVMLLTLPLVLGLCRLTVQVDGHGLRISSAILGFPLRRIALDEIKDVETEHINPGQWGGWGWRFFPGGSAIVFKAMDGLVVHTVSGKRFAVTMEGSEQVRDQLLAQLRGGRMS
ncbi:hypothetical protein OK351_00895 [Glutamicibacter sp. MNS18]|uniref:hypothetical protein n=1 Tax=Glutamicibacter sp. MNS18 TaxID=2989817 RepID=UPI002236B8CD|nr:hypothetical protein [Glutamicibacter sp. MNS18]MCW4464074.1 hypothetical protein [Glutamicibacter sp. MNS18]